MLTLLLWITMLTGWFLGLIVFSLLAQWLVKGLPDKTIVLHITRTKRPYVTIELV